MKWENSVFQDLIGKKIIKIYVNDKMISFYTYTNISSEIFNYVVDGDCCSESWFSDIVNADKLFHQEITQIEYIEDDVKLYNLDDGRARQECSEVYGYGIRTEKGLCKIFYRNDSNGYYSGSLFRYIPLKDEIVLMEVVNNNWKNHNTEVSYVNLFKEF